MLRICYCEDEPAQVLAMKQILLKWPEAALTVYSSAEAFLFEHGLGAKPAGSAQQPACPFDLLILDIQLDQMSGMELAKRVRQWDASVAIIFLTNDPAYVFAGYEVAAARYFMKPLSEEKLFPVLRELEEKQTTEKKYWIFTMDGEKVKLDTEQMISIEAVGHYIKIQTAVQCFEIKKSLQEAARELPDTEFISPHRSYLVQIKAIRRITRISLILENGQEIPLSRNRYQEVNEAFIRTNR